MGAAFPPCPTALPLHSPFPPPSHLASHNLGRCIAGAAAVDVQLLAGCEEGGQPKIYELERARAVQQHILQLDVTVHHLSRQAGKICEQSER